MIGMPYKILPTIEFSKDFRKLDPQMQKRVKLKFEEVAEDPTRYKFLQRVIFSYNSNKKEVYAEKIVFGHRYRE